MRTILTVAILLLLGQWRPSIAQDLVITNGRGRSRCRRDQGVHRRRGQRVGRRCPRSDQCGGRVAGIAAHAARAPRGGHARGSPTGVRSTRTHPGGRRDRGRSGSLRSPGARRFHRDDGLLHFAAVRGGSRFRARCREASADPGQRAAPDGCRRRRGLRNRQPRLHPTQSPARSPISRSLRETRSWEFPS